MNLNWGIKQDVELQAEFECKEEELNWIEIKFEETFSLLISWMHPRWKKVLQHFEQEIACFDFCLCF